MQTQFELPANLPAEKLITEMSQQVGLHLVGRELASKTFYDSFDWRLYSNGWVAEVVNVGKGSRFSLRQLADNAVVDSEAITSTPAFADQFQRQSLKKLLQPVLEMRALILVASVDFESFQAKLVNSNEKTVARLHIDYYADLPCCRVTLMPIKGYQNAAENAVAFMTSKLAVSAVKEPLIDWVLSRQGRSLRDYSAKLDIRLAYDLRADIACKHIYSRLLNIIKANESWVIADIDSEFLHDFRVAIRKTRTGLGQLKGVLPGAIRSETGEFFSWLGQITGPTRDFDVYLLNFEGYKNSLPEFVRGHMDPLHAYLFTRQQQSQQEMAKKLSSDRYLQGMARWGQYLREQCARYPPEPAAKWPIKQLADIRIWQAYRRVIKEGDAICDDSAPEALHELRKSCKKLRYLLEFFDSLYPKKELKPLLRHLKALQEVLGNFQDFQVQETHLLQFGSELQARHVPAETLMAMGMLVQHLSDAQLTVRTGFADVYREFREPKTQKGFKRLFSGQAG